MVAGNDPHRRWIAWLLGWIRPTPLYTMLALLSARRVVVSGASMYPLLRPGDGVLFDRLAFQLRPPRRGDIVLAEPVQSSGRTLVKLIAGLPGENIAAHADRLWIDGRRLPFPQPVVGSLPSHWQLGPNEYFLLSFAVAVGTDSRHFGPVPGSALLGLGWLVYRPSHRRRRLEPAPLELDEDIVVDGGRDVRDRTPQSPAG